MTETIEERYGPVEIAHGVRIPKEVEDMNRKELEDCIYQIAEFASRTLISARTMRGILRNAIQKD